MISISIFSRAFSARSREISICSGVIGLPLSTLPSLPSAYAFTQLRIDCSGTPISRCCWCPLTAGKLTLPSVILHGVRKEGRGRSNEQGASLRASAASPEKP